MPTVANSISDLHFKSITYSFPIKSINNRAPPVSVLLTISYTAIYFLSSNPIAASLSPVVLNPKVKIPLLNYPLNWHNLDYVLASQT